MSLRIRLVAAFAYVLVLVVVAIEVPLALNLARRVDAEVRRQASAEARVLAAEAAARLDDQARLTRLARSAAVDLGGRVIVVDAAGRLLADSAGSGLRGASYATRPEIAAALGGATAQGTRHSASLDQDLLYTAVPVLRDGARSGAVRVTQSVDAVQREVRRDVLVLLALGLVAVLLGLAVAWLLAGSLARPLRALARTAHRVAEGRLDERAAVEGSTEQREVAEAFNDMTARLARGLIAQREFVANASHQLRTPLTGLRLRLEAAGLKTRDEAVRREIEAAERETERLARLLSELLTLAREAERPESAAAVDVASLVRDARERWEAPAEQAGHELRLVATGGAGAHVDAAEGDLAIVLDNLLENAIRYAPADTPVTLEWGAAGGWVELAVCDEGPGLAPEERERVFERFFRGRAGAGDPTGTGLGLAIVRAFAERWGGSAAMSNRDGGGLRAAVRLPLATPPLPALDRTLDGALPGRG